jgi:hypothetical protein
MAALSLVATIVAPKSASPGGSDGRPEIQDLQVEVTQAPDSRQDHSSQPGRVRQLRSRDPDA